MDITAIEITDAVTRRFPSQVSDGNRQVRDNTAIEIAAQNAKSAYAD